MPDLRLTLADIDNLAARLRFIAAEFEDAGSIAEGYAEHMGHDDLSHEVEQFADNWRHKRRKLMNKLDEFAEKADTAAETFTGVEDQFVQALEGE